MKYKSLLFSCLLGSVGVLSTQAMAGGAVGGDCCADLEERVAELEATTVRKGNRKVSLQISGNVHYAMIWREVDGVSNDLELTDTAPAQTKFRLVGKARISSDIYAGYRLEFGVGRGDPISDLRYNEVFIGSKTLGKLSIGQGSAATDFVSEVDLSGTIYSAGGSLNEYSGTPFGGAARYGTNIDGFGRVERIRYDSPSLAGFKVSASWQENDDVDVALRYGGAVGDFTIAAALGYYNDESHGDGVSGSASVLHRPTGLSLTVAAGDADTYAASLNDGNADGSYEFWYVKAGIQRKLFAAGKTAFSVDYMDMDDGSADKIGVQLVQNIDAAAMKLYISAWDAESDSAGYADETGVMAGASISF